VEGDPSTRRWIETRIMLRQQGEWAGYSYEWNDEQTDAALVAAEGKDRAFTIRTAELETRGEGMTTRPWHYPSRAECMVCHSRASNYVLGLCTVQLNHDFDYRAALGDGHAADNQLRTLEHLGLLEVNWWADATASLHERAAAAGVEERGRGAWVTRQMASGGAGADGFGRRRSALLSRAPARTNRLVNPYDVSHSLEDRARSYLQSNCSSCHVGAGGGNAAIDLEYRSAYGGVALEATRTVGVKPLHSAFDLVDARLIAAGHPERSVLVARMSRRGPGQMPQLATAIVDVPAVEVVRAWIESLAAPPGDLSTR
jgi:mono/diheme cytochrome c family protein